MAPYFISEAVLLANEVLSILFITSVLRVNATFMATVMEHSLSNYGSTISWKDGMNEQYPIEKLYAHLSRIT